MATNKITKRPEDRNSHRPDIRDDLDSRKNEEQSFKGDDTTHNKKETEGERKKKK
ncbi:MAG TPA: hypothetical protein VLS85_11610 [Hanamia sp.]|nr:hypothetical protein [Hanamia sp.]